MKRARQFGLLTLMLIFPVFVIWFLRTFGENKFTIPVFHQNASELSSDYCTFPEGQHYIPPFQLRNQQNAPLTEKLFDDHITVVNFFFTNCRIICSELTQELARVQGNFENNPRVRLLSISVDPVNDQPDVLARYAEEFGARERQWSFATGLKEEINTLIRCGFILPASTSDEVVEELFFTNDQFVLVDSQRRIRGYYSGTEREEVDRLITEMKILLEEEQF